MFHSILAPSAAGIWGKPEGCPGYVIMSQTFPDSDGPEAAEGTEFHKLVARALESGQRNPRNVEGFRCSDEQYEAAEMALDDVMSVRDKHLHGHFEVEKQVSAPIRVHPENRGTVDAYFYDPYTRELWIWDFKFGYGVVEVFRNWQLIDYAAAIFDLLEINGFEDQNLTVHFRIIQPRAFHSDGPIREWTIRGSDLRGDFNKLRANAALAVSGNAVTRSGPHCRYCPARHACKTALDAGLGLYELASKPTPLIMKPEALGIQYGIVKRAREQLEYLETGLKTEIEGRMRKGVRVPGYHMEAGKGRERWARPVSEVLALGELCDVELGKVEAITPFQARKIMPNEMLEGFTERPNQAMKLVSDASRTTNVFQQREASTK